jgi:hypothetical protein
VRIKSEFVKRIQLVSGRRFIDQSSVAVDE